MLDPSTSGLLCMIDGRLVGEPRFARTSSTLLPGVLCEVQFLPWYNIRMNIAFFCQSTCTFFVLLGPCWKVFISRGLGYGIVAGSTLGKSKAWTSNRLVNSVNSKSFVGVCLVKLPQMVKIFSGGSVKGLSLVSFLLELVSVTFSMTYNVANQYPFR